jgi:hypothetical protein
MPAVVQAPTADVSTPELAGRICERAAHIAAATYQLLVDLAEFDRRDGWGGEGVKSLAHWLNWKCGYSLRTARDLIRVARALPKLPKISEAFSKGTLSYCKVRALTRIVTPESEEALLVFAISGTTAHVEKLVRLYRKWVPGTDLDGAAIALKHKVEWLIDDDGSYEIRMRLPADAGAEWVKALNKVEDEIRKTRACADTDAPRNGSREPRDDRVEAVAELARRELSGDREAVPTAERYQVMVHVDAEVLAGGEGSSYLEDGGVLPSETLKRVLCDTSMVIVVHDADGKVIKISDRKRTIPRAKRRALKMRDLHCRFPGCANKRFLDAHHIEHWIEGGDHELDNLMLLCPFHHRLHHQGLFKITTELDGRFTFIHRNGSVIETAAFVVEPSGVERMNANLGLSIDKNTIPAKWGGETCDYAMAVSHLARIAERKNGSREPRLSGSPSS